MEIETMRETPASRARRTTASRSPSYSFMSRWACVSTSMNELCAIGTRPRNGDPDGLTSRTNFLTCGPV